jgi:hypothetical protein
MIVLQAFLNLIIAFERKMKMASINQETWHFNGM